MAVPALEACPPMHLPSHLDVVMALGTRGSLCEQEDFLQRCAEAAGLSSALLTSGNVGPAQQAATEADGPPEPGAALFQALDRLAAEGRIGPNTLYIIYMHGSIGSAGHHRMQFTDGERIPTGRIVERLRHPSHGRQCHAMVVLVSCEILGVAGELAAYQGPHLVLGGMDSVLTQASMQTLAELLRFRGACKNDRERYSHPGFPHPRDMLEKAALYFGDTVSLHDRALGTMVRQAETPEQLQDANRETRKHAFFAQVFHGKLKQAQAMLDAWPELLAERIGGKDAIRHALGREQYVLAAGLMERARDGGPAGWDMFLRNIVPFTESHPDGIDATRAWIRQICLASFDGPRHVMQDHIQRMVPQRRPNACYLKTFQALIQKRKSGQPEVRAFVDVFRLMLQQAFLVSPGCASDLEAICWRSLGMEMQGNASDVLQVCLGGRDQAIMKPLLDATLNAWKKDPKRAHGHHTEWVEQIATSAAYMILELFELKGVPDVVHALNACMDGEFPGKLRLAMEMAADNMAQWAQEDAGEDLPHAERAIPFERRVRKQLQELLLGLLPEGLAKSYRYARQARQFVANH